MAIGARASESQFEGGFEKKATKNHEVVTIAVLWLHYLN
jgi:hypothetical protein